MKHRFLVAYVIALSFATIACGNAETHFLSTQQDSATGNLDDASVTDDAIVSDNMPVTAADAAVIDDATVSNDMTVTADAAAIDDTTVSSGDYDSGSPTANPVQSGCYLEKTDGNKVRISDSVSDCVGYLFAFSYGERKDALRLLIKDNNNEKTPSQDLDNFLQSELDNLENATESYVFSYISSELDPICPDNDVCYSNMLDISSQQKTDHTETTLGIKPYDKQCDKLSFFGVSLHCFNVGEGNMAKIIVPLVFLKMAGYAKNYNSIQAFFDRNGYSDYNAYIEPFNLLRKEKIELVNGFAQDALAITFGADNDLHCTDSDTKINSCFRFMDVYMKHRVFPYSDSELYSGYPFSTPVFGEGVRFIGVMSPSSKANKDYGLAIYHEAHHKLFGSHGAALERKNCPMKQSLDGYDDRTGDKDWPSTNGAQAELAFQLSANEFLDCDERTELYEYAKSKLKDELCAGFLCSDFPKEPWKCIDYIHIYPEVSCGVQSSDDS